MIKQRRVLAVAGAALVASMLLAGCTNTEAAAPAAPAGSEDAGDATAAPSGEAALGTGGRELAEGVEVDEDVAALVPAAIADAGVMSIVTDPTYAPMDFTDEAGEIIGLEPDMAVAVAARMGLDVEFASADFNGILAGIESNRYDASWGAWSVTPERAAVVDMVSYLNAGSAVMVQPGSEGDYASIDDLCGLTLAVQTGTVQALDVLPAFEQNCTDKALPEIEPLVVPQQDSANQAVASGRADAMIADNALVAYYAQVQPDAYAAVPGILVDPAPLAVVAPKGEESLAPAFQAALQSLIDDGTYAEILEAWGLADAALESAEINPELG
jgi:polar amino acid transport system substrate-binding protein